MNHRDPTVPRRKMTDGGPINDRLIPATEDEEARAFAGTIRPASYVTGRESWGNAAHRRRSPYSEPKE